MRVRIVPTWRSNNARPLLRRVQWGVLSGTAGIFDGLVQVVSLGQLASDVQLTVLVRLTEAEHRRWQAQQEKVNA